MNKHLHTSWIWLAAAVIAHLAVSMIHGTAHARAGIPMSAAQTVFIFVVILAGPPIGLGLMWFRQRAGALTVAYAMGASLVFGLVNHFVVAGPDHVTHVVAPVRAVFATTAIFLVLTEGLGTALAVRYLVQVARTRSGPSFNRVSTSS
jgi:hypothetical protein